MNVTITISNNNIATRVIECMKHMNSISKEFFVAILQPQISQPTTISVSIDLPFRNIFCHCINNS